MIRNFILKIMIWRIFIIYKNKLPSKSQIVDSKMNFEGLSGAFYWEDEGLWEANYRLANAFKYVIHERMKLVVGPANDVGVMESKSFDKQIFKMAKRYFPDWIGFDKARCSYNPELAERMMRIIKVADWRFQKMLKEDDEIYKANNV